MTKSITLGSTHPTQNFRSNFVIPIPTDSIQQVISQQQLFIQQIQASLILLKTYSKNPTHFPLLLSKQIQKHYHLNFSVPSYIAESFDELTSDLVYQNKFFILKPSGIFDTLHFTTKSKAISLQSFNSYFLPLSKSSWQI